MTTNGRHLETGAGRSGPITEAELLAAIEGGGDSVSSGPVLSDRTEAMRADRTILRGLPNEPAPAWLLDAALGEALGEIDHETLHRLGEGEPSSDRLPVSQITPERFNIVRWLRTHPQRIGFAAAAAVVLVIGGVAGMSIRGWLRASPMPTPPIAMEDISARPGGEANEITTDQSVPGVVDSPDPIVIADITPIEPDVTRPTPTLFEAAGLLAEGRLVVIARGGSSPSIPAALETLTRQRIGPDHSWSLTMGMPEAVLAAIDLPTVEQPVFASDGEPGAEIIIPERSAWTAKLRATPTSLAALLDGLKDAGLDVELRELGEAVSIEPGVNPDDVLWWSRPPSSWKRSVAVPVVVETLP